MESVYATTTSQNNGCINNVKRRGWIAVDLKCAWHKKRYILRDRFSGSLSCEGFKTRLDSTRRSFEEVLIDFNRVHARKDNFRRERSVALPKLKCDAPNQIPGSSSAVMERESCGEI